MDNKCPWCDGNGKIPFKRVDGSVDNFYKTSDTALASYLIAADFPLQSIDYSQPRYEFSFPMSLQIQEHATRFLIGKALTNPSIFFKVNKKLRRIIHNQRQWEED